MEKLTLREDVAAQEKPEAKGLASTSGEHNTLSDAEIRRFQVGSAANNSFPEINPSLLDQVAADETPATTGTNSPLVEDRLAWVSEVKPVTENPKVVEGILAGTNLTVTPEEVPGTYRETLSPADPAAPTEAQLKTTGEIFVSSRPKNIDRVIPSEGPLGDLTRHGEVPIDIASSRLARPEEITYATDRTPAAAYLNGNRAAWQTPVKQGTETAANAPSFLDRIKRLFGG